MGLRQNLLQKKVDGPTIGLSILWIMLLINMIWSESLNYFIKGMFNLAVGLIRSKMIDPISHPIIKWAPLLVHKRMKL